MFRQRAPGKSSYATCGVHAVCTNEEWMIARSDGRVHDLHQRWVARYWRVVHFRQLFPFVIGRKQEYTPSRFEGFLA